MLPTIYPSFARLSSDALDMPGRTGGKKLIDLKGEKHCYNELRKCPTKRATRVAYQLARLYDCSITTVHRSAQRYRDRIGLNDGEEEEEVDTMLVTTASPPLAVSARPVQSGRRQYSANGVRATKQTVTSRHHLANCASARSSVTTVANISTSSNGGGAFEAFLISIGVNPSLSIVFAECNFRSEHDLVILKGFPAKTLEKILEEIKSDGRIALKEWGLIHAALRKC